MWVGGLTTAADPWSASKTSAPGQFISKGELVSKPRSSRVRPIGVMSLVALAICAFVVAAAARAGNTLTVCASGCGYTSIQAAVDAASSGDTISISAGTYNVPGHLKVTKGLTIQGAGKDATTIDTSQACSSGCTLLQSYGFYISGATSAVTLEGFRLIGPTQTNGYGLKLDGDRSGVT